MGLIFTGLSNMLIRHKKPPTAGPTQQPCVRLRTVAGKTCDKCIRRMGNRSADGTGDAFQAEMIAQGGSSVVGAEQAALLQDRHDQASKIVELARKERR